MNWKAKKTWLDISYIPLLITACIAVGTIYIIYNQTEDILKERLREKMVVAAGLAATKIDANDVEKVRGPQDVSSRALANLTDAMRKIRSNIKDAKYVYILRLTQKPAQSQFVADADMLNPVDWDGNGKIDEVEVPPLPGDEYDISGNAPARLALASPTAASSTYTDKWGTFLSSYAPIRNDAGEAVAVIGVDVQVDQFSALIQAMRMPLTILGILFIALLVIETGSMIGIWRGRVEIFKELDRQKDELLGIVAHQLAKPITAIRWDLESLLDGDLGQMNEKQKAEAAIMRGQAVNLADLVSMILDVSRIQLGRIQLAPQPLDLNAFFAEILQVVQPQIVQKKLDFIKKMPKTLPTVLLDKRYTRMTVENMLTNAVKYTPDSGKVTFDLSIENGVLRCSVSDTGCGIPKAEQDKIFGKMYRASNVRNTVEGNGFGLYVAKGAIEGQGGKMWFTSEEGKGTTFFIELPLKEVGKQD